MKQNANVLIETKRKKNKQLYRFIDNAYSIVGLWRDSKEEALKDLEKQNSIFKKEKTLIVEEL